MSHLLLRQLSKHYARHTVVDAVSLEVAEGEMVVLLGPSGCGKTTTLRMIGGFTPIDDGDILLDGSSIRALPPHRREMGIVFQSYALFPHMSVARNVAFGLEMRGQKRNQVAARIAEMLRLVKLEDMAERLPRQLSGGQQQRVALARALAIHPKLLLLDEPLSNLDASLRQEVARDIRILQRDGNLTAIMVTHDQDEAMAMADRLVVMRDGGVQQIGTQEDLYERPATPFVARFIGHSNMLNGAVAEGAFVLPSGTRATLARNYPRADTATLALRPERLALTAQDAAEARLPGIVELSTYLGAIVEHVVAVDGMRIVIRESATAARARHRPGERVAITWSDAGERLFAGAAPLHPTSSAPDIHANRVTHHA